MPSRARRTFGDLAVSAGVLAAVLGVLVSVDVRVREHAQRILRSASPEDIGETGAQVREIGSALVDAARTQSLDHAPLLIFAVVGTVLLLALARS